MESGSPGQGETGKRLGQVKRGSGFIQNLLYISGVATGHPKNLDFKIRQAWNYSYHLSTGWPWEGHIRLAQLYLPIHPMSRVPTLPLTWFQSPYFQLSIGYLHLPVPEASLKQLSQIWPHHLISSHSPLVKSPTLKSLMVESSFWGSASWRPLGRSPQLIYKVSHCEVSIMDGCDPWPSCGNLPVMVTVPINQARDQVTFIISLLLILMSSPEKSAAELCLNQPCFSSSLPWSLGL